MTDCELLICNAVHWPVSLITVCNRLRWVPLNRPTQCRIIFWVVSFADTRRGSVCRYSETRSVYWDCPTETPNWSRHRPGGCGDAHSSEPRHKYDKSHFLLHILALVAWYMNQFGWFWYMWPMSLDVKGPRVSVTAENISVGPGITDCLTRLSSCTKKYYPAPILSGPTVHPPAFRMCVTLLLVSLVHKRGIIYSLWSSCSG